MEMPFRYFSQLYQRLFFEKQLSSIHMIYIYRIKAKSIQNVILKIHLIFDYPDIYKRSGSFILQHLQPPYRYIYIMCQLELIVVACFCVKNIQQLRDTIIQLCSFMKPTKFFLQHYVYKIFFDTKKELQTHLALPKKSE